MDSVVDNGPPPPCPAPFNLAAHVLARAERLGDKPALEVLHGAHAEAWSHARLVGTVRGTAAGLRRAGLAPGARVLMRVGNTPEFPICYLAAIWAGLVPVPTSPQLTAPEITAIARQIDPALIVAAPDVALPDPLSCPVIDLARLRSLADAPAIPPDLGDPERPAYIIFTSGTSGGPRAVVHAHRAIWARGLMTEGWYGLREDDRLLHAGAFNWTYTLGTGLLDPWTVGATALIPAPGTAPADLLRLLADHRATIFAAAPGVYRQMLRAPVPPLPALRHGLSAGEKLHPAIRHDWEAATGTLVHEAFGMSECSTFLSGAPSRPAPEGTTGYPQHGRRVAILGQDGRPVPRGAEGTIAVAATDPGLMLGYLDRPEETRARFTEDGAWFLTGDSGAMAEDGAIAYLGRGDDMMNAGGYRVSPLEVEAAMMAHPEITDAAAVERAVPSGATIIALHYAAADRLDEDVLARFAAARLARYKCPRIYIHHTALPRGANNKLLRRTLRAEESPPDGQA